jgi:HK97 family phage portal protein
MGWLDRLLGRGVKRVTDNDQWLAATVTRGDVSSAHGWGAKDRGAQEMLNRASQWVEVCSRRNATVCASQPLRLYVPARGGNKERSWSRRVADRNRQKDLRSPVRGKAAQWAEAAGEVEEVFEHPVLELIRNPNPWQRWAEFAHLNFYSLELCGNRYWHVVMGPGGVQALYAMAPQHTRVVPDENQFVAGYVYGRDGTIEATFDTDEVLHSKFMPSLRNPYYGVGPLAGMFSEADMDAASTASELARWKNDARPDWALMVPPESSRPNIEALEANIESRFRGVSNRGKFLISTLADIKPLQWSAKEMEYIAGKGDCTKRILAAFGVPESEVFMNDANLASSRTGSIQYLRNTVNPRICAQAEELTETLLPLFGITPGEMWFCYDNPVPSDEAATATLMVSLVGGRILTVNEARSELGYEPVEGGDEFPEPVSPFGAQPPMGEPEDDESEPEDDEEDDSEDAGEAEAKAVPPDPAPCPHCGQVHKHTHVTKRTKSIHEIGLNLTHGMFFDNAVSRLVSALNSIVPQVTLNGAVDAEELMKRLEPTIQGFTLPSLDIGWSRAAEEVRQDVPPDRGGALNVVPQYAIDAVKRRGVKVAGDVTGTISAEVTDAIARSLAEGKSRNDAMREVAVALGPANQHKAALIADTEISRSYIAGNAAVYKEAGIERTEWATAADPCPICEEAAANWNSKAMDAQASFDEIINGGYATLDNPRPPQHPRCRCSLEPVIPESWGAKG